ncbi:MAG: helix-turn-helix transcriptional regulator [Idiomarinaceae bacterium]|uniref:helix-turn-helix domain-containing protein n=1 Tax=Idiomarina sp. 28-8 TaxID=1260624 RepID=UPI0003114DEA|nr:helix-turn-helix transcriptional regulator [Idiomarina sp. 28-8]NWO03466.1 helix-turn-helix transcriptional regulator [Idiomarinaceae bacterium]
MKTIKDIAERLIAERKKQNLSQKDMRMLIGMSQQQYQRVESGQDLKVSTLLRILAGLGLELSITDPEQVENSQKAESSHSADDFWSSKHKHLED